MTFEDILIGQSYDAGVELGCVREGVRWKFQSCPAGEFQMGAPENEEADEYQHHVTLTKRFWIGKHKLNQEQWKAITGEEHPSYKTLAPARNKRRLDQADVTGVSWFDAVEFIYNLNQKFKLPKEWKFALPTEDQWEYACRSGTTTKYYFGDTKKDEGKFKAWHHSGENRWGIHDMLSRQPEWCQDYYLLLGYELDAIDPLPKVGHKEPSGKHSNRVIRGGAYDDWYRRSAQRMEQHPSTDVDPCYGPLSFRVAIVNSDRINY